MTQTEAVYVGSSTRRQGKILFHYIFKTLPLVKKELNRWRQEARLGVDPVLKTQALNSINNKDFHCYGGAVFAVNAGHQEKELIQLLVAYQTICDYLDNLCDRNDCFDGQAFLKLHASLLDALQPDREKSNYYQYYPHQEDGGYLDKLVDCCRNSLRSLPAFLLVQDDMVSLAQWYIDLQVKKHLNPDQREIILIEWAEGHLPGYPGIRWQEFAAASGSTLAIFALMLLSGQSRVDPDASQHILKAYFPWICGLHILLDYFIDQQEDREGGDLNFTFYYADNADMLYRLEYFVRQAHQQTTRLDDPAFAKTVVEGLLALYLSDPKIKSQGYQQMARSLLTQSGRSTFGLLHLCSIVRKFF